MANKGFGRWWRHFWLDTRDVPRLLGSGALERIEAQVVASESRHSGEIRVCVEASLPNDQVLRGIGPRARAVDLFASLRVWDTEANNGVLIYLLLADHSIEVVADRGLNAHVPETEWAELVSQMRAAFQRGAFEAGLSHAVATVDSLLCRHFPVTAATDNPDELPNAPVVL